MSIQEAPLSYHRSGLNTGWTTERTDVLRYLWSVKQWSASDIAISLGGFDHCLDGGRSAVIGKVHRLKLPVRDCDRTGRSKATNTELRREARPKTRHVADHLVKAAREAAQRQVRAPAPEAALEIPPHQRVPLLALAPEGCRFPIGDPQDPDFGFCPREHVYGSAYCAHHHRIAYTPRASARPRGQHCDFSWG